MRAINSSVMKLMNRKMILDCIRRQPISRAELSDQTHLTRASITQIVDELMADGLVAESAVVGRKQPGRRLTQLALVSDSRYILGVNLTRIHYDLGIINLGGEVIFEHRGQLAGRPVSEVVDEICRVLWSVIREKQLSEERIMGLGLCTPGPLDPRTGTILNPPNFSAWHNLPIADMMEQRLGIRPILRNISNACTLDEMYFGIGREGAENFMVLHVDEGVGAGFILRNRLFTGSHDQSLEVGHVSIDMNGPLCACGNRGCLERYISFPAVLEGTRFSCWPEVIDSLDSDPDARALMDRVADILAFQIVNIINMFDMEKTVLSGNYLYGGELLARAINRRIHGRSLRQVGSDPVVSGRALVAPRIAAMPAYHAIFSN